uniref:Uncharacterized protein n=1 Tax=Oryza nivara TaxID=4536 RepID=A0A0E0ICP7_ORYNI
MRRRKQSAVDSSSISSQSPCMQPKHVFPRTSGTTVSCRLRSVCWPEALIGRWDWVGRRLTSTSPPQIAKASPASLPPDYCLCREP